MWRYFGLGSSAETSGRDSRRRRTTIDLQLFNRQNEMLYPPWWTQKGLMSWYRELPDDTLWNSYVCGAVLLAVVGMVTRLQSAWYLDLLDALYNISYAAHVVAIGYRMLTERENTDVSFWIVCGYLIDLGTFSHYVSRRHYYKLGCYYLRLHRPFKYLWSLHDYNLRGSILGTTLKYCYIFMVLRITWAWIWLHVNLLEQQFNVLPSLLTPRRTSVQLSGFDSNDSDATRFLSSLYIVNKMFIPIGMPVYPDNDIERVTCLFVILSGCLVVTGAAVATLSLVISLYMSPEETFRSRYKLIIKEMNDSMVPLSLREKVQKFYHMYWHKHRAVSETQLLPTFPPTLPATVYTDIYFEATQKSRILRELSYQFLSELAKKMETIHYIPGDAIIQRTAKKSAIIYITYGDVEMLTAEDDMTAILRLSRGTVLSPCGGAAAAGVCRAHLGVRAATFCTAHVLLARDLWRAVNKHSRSQDNAAPILAAFTDHIEKVKRHYSMKIPVASVHKSSILHFNRNLMALKEKKDANGQPLLASTDMFLEIAGSYIMRNRLDSTLTDESDAICLRPTFPCILRPGSSLLWAWHCAVATLILIICVTHPYYLVFLKNVPMEFRFFDYMATAVYIVDHIVHLSTGAHVEEGVPITFAQTSSQQMRSKWFLLDVVGTLPIFEFIGDGHFAGINKILRLPKVFRLLKTMEDNWVYHSNVLRFCSYTLLLLIACYLIAAMQQAFMCYQSGYCLVTNFTHSPFWEEKALDEETVMARLTFGLYWAISMITFTSHMETWGKENMSNVMYTMIILEFCIVLKTFMEAVYSATIMVTTAMREDYDACIATVKRFLIRNEVDPELRKRFITYLQLCWYTDKAYKMTQGRKTASIFYDLPRHVYKDIVGRNRIKYVLCIPFMKMLKKEELKQLASNAHLYYTSPNEILMNTGDLVNEMYVVVKGICEFICPVTHMRMGEHTAKSNFGACDCLLRLPAYYTVRALTHVQIFCISIRHLKPVFENPQIKEAIEYIKTQPEYARLQKGPPPFLKYEPLPPIPNTERFPLPRKHEHDLVYLHPFQSLGFFSILRYIFPRFTIRPDGTYLLRYEWFRVSCALLSALVFPNYTYLVLQWPWLYYLTCLLDLSAMFDIFQRMLVAYYNEEGILVYHPSSTAAYYIKGPFIVDLIGCLALEKLESERIETYENGYRVTPIEQFLMLNRLLQLYRFPSIMQTLHFIERQDIHLICYTVPLFISMFNVLTCLMVFNSVKIFYFVNDQGQTRWLLEPFQDQGGSWIYLFRNTFRFNLTSSPWNLYLATHFWVVYETTTTGYGKFRPSNNHLMEILFIGMAMIIQASSLSPVRFNPTSSPWNLYLATHFWVAIIFSAMIVTYFSVRIISIRSNVNKPLAGFQQHMRDINMYMKRENLEPALQRELRCYYEYNWEKMGGIDYRGMLKLCNQITLRTDAILHIYGPTFAKCPLLAQCDLSLLRMIGRSVRSIYFVRDMKIIECDDVVGNVYFVDYGGVESRITIGDINQVVRLPRGSLFGNLDGTPAERVPMNIVATSRTHLLMINSQAFYHIINDFPATKELMDQSRKAANKHYILGNMEEFKVKFTRLPDAVPFRPRRMDVIKYIYFQKGLIQLYLIIVSLSCIYMDMYNAGYQDNRAWLILTLYILDMCFFMKILMQFSLPLLVTKKNLKTLLLPIRRMYFKREFKYDMISCVPVELVSLRLSYNRWFCFSWLRLNRMFRIVTVYNCLKRRNERVKVNIILNTILTVSVWFSVFVHATTCLWYFIGTLEEHAQPKSSWVYHEDGSSWCRNEYICSLYFIITTFTQNGVGDIMPKKQSEVIFVTILMIISTLVFMIYVGEFSNIIQYQAFRSFSFYSKYLELQAFLKNNRVSRNLVTIVNKYTLHLWRESRGMQVPRFLTKAPHSLRLRVMSAAYMHHMSRHHIFQNCEPAFLRQLVGCLRLYTYNEEMYVVKEKEITNCMYLIHRGKVKESSDDTENMILARVYPAGSYFGVGLIRDTPYTYSYQTMIKSQVLTLHLDDWEYLLAHFPQSKSAIHKNMGNLGDEHMDDSKWPGGLDPDYPPGAERTQTESETNITNLPKFYNKRMSEHSGPGQVSMASTVSWLSKTESKFELEVAGPSLQAKQYSPTPSMGPSPSLDNMPATPDHDKEDKEAPKMGLLEKITSTVMKPMGRYSDSELESSLAEVREDLVLEEDATGMLLKQLDEAIRLSREKHRKHKHRSSKDSDSSEEENTEKYMFTYDMDLDEAQSSNIKEPPSRTLRIKDENSTDSVPADKSTTSIASDIIEKAVDVDKAPENISGPSKGVDKKEVLSILKRPKSSHKIETTADSSSGAEVQSKLAKEEPSVGKRKIVSLDLDNTKDNANDRSIPPKDNAPMKDQVTKLESDDRIAADTQSISDTPAVLDKQLDESALASIETLTTTESQVRPDTQSNLDTSLTEINKSGAETKGTPLPENANTQYIGEALVTAVSRPDTQPKSMSDTPATQDILLFDTETLLNTLKTAINQFDENTQPVHLTTPAMSKHDSGVGTESFLDDIATAFQYNENAKTVPLTPTLSKHDTDTKSIPSTRASDDSVLNTDTIVSADTPKTKDSRPDEIRRISSTPETAIQPDADTLPVPDILVTASNEQDADSITTSESVLLEEDQPGPDIEPITESLVKSKRKSQTNIQAKADEQPNLDTQSVPDTSNIGNNEPNTNTAETISGSLRMEPSQRDADTQPIPESIVPAISKSQVETVLMPDKLGTTDDQRNLDTQPVLAASGLATSQPDADAIVLSISTSETSSESQLDADTQPIPSNLETPTDNFKKTETQPDADAEPVPDDLVPGSSQLLTDLRSVPETQVPPSESTPNIQLLRDTQMDSKSLVAQPTKDDDKLKTKASLIPEQKRKPVSLKYEDDGKPTTSRTDVKKAKEKTEKREVTKTDSSDSDENAASNKKTESPPKK